MWRLSSSYSNLPNVVLTDGPACKYLTTTRTESFEYAGLNDCKLNVEIVVPLFYHDNGTILYIQDWLIVELIDGLAYPRSSESPSPVMTDWSIGRQLCDHSEDGTVGPRVFDCWTVQGFLYSALTMTGRNYQFYELIDGLGCSTATRRVPCNSSDWFTDGWTNWRLACSCLTMTRTESSASRRPRSFSAASASGPTRIRCCTMHTSI